MAHVLPLYLHAVAPIHLPRARLGKVLITIVTFEQLHFFSNDFMQNLSKHPLNALKYRDYDIIENSFPGGKYTFSNIYVLP